MSRALTISGRPRVLCVDDEPQVLAGLVFTLRRHFDVTTALGGHEGLRVLAECGRFAVVISDFCMPEMDGAEFLGRVRERAPETVRMLLTGHASLDGAIAAVNRGQIFRILTKPCPSAEMVRAIEDAVEQARLITGDRDLVQRKLEAMTGQLLQAERLATLGTLAGAVGHELNNLLVAFGGALDFIAQNAANQRPPEPEDLETLQTVRTHLSIHARHLLHLGRPGAQGEGSADLCRVALDTLSMLRSAGVLRPTEMEVDLPPEEAMVALPKTRIEQVMVNLVKNAVDAVRDVRGRNRRVAVCATIDDARRRVFLRVEDNGCGIPKDNLPMIFEPYYTSKAPEVGTGLGLFVVKQIVESIGGTLAVTSEEGVGTTFAMELPLLAAAESAAEVPAPEPTRAAETSLPVRRTL